MTDTKCLECGLPTNGKTYCGERCKSLYNVARFIKLIKRNTVTLAEAASVTGLAEEEVRNRVRRAKIEKFNIDSRIRIRRSDALRLAS